MLYNVGCGLEYGDGWELGLWILMEFKSFFEENLMMVYCIIFVKYGYLGLWGRDLKLY